RELEHAVDRGHPYPVLITADWLQVMAARGRQIIGGSSFETGLGRRTADLERDELIVAQGPEQIILIGPEHLVRADQLSLDELLGVPALARGVDANPVTPRRRGGDVAVWQ